MEGMHVLLSLPEFVDAVDGKLKRKDIKDNSVNVRIPEYEGMEVGDWVTVPSDVQPRPPLDYPAVFPQTFQVTEVADFVVSIRPPWDSDYWVRVDLFYYVWAADGSIAISQLVQVDVV